LSKRIPGSVAAALVLIAALAACGGGTADGGQAAAAPPTPVSPAPAMASSAATTAASSPASRAAGKQQQSPPSGSEPFANSLDGRFIVGYQGWYGCPGDFGNNKDWVHWFAGSPAAGGYLVDMMPDLGGIAVSDLCDTGLQRPDGSRVYVYSSQNGNVVDHQFAQMAAAGVGGAAVQRFVVEFSKLGHRARMDNVLRNALHAAEHAGVPFFVAYDVTGTDDATVIDAIRTDWQHLVDDLKLTASPAYLRDGGRPVVQLWGFGVIDHPGRPGPVLQLVQDLRQGRAGLHAATVIGGVATYWRTDAGDAQPDPAWDAVYAAYDVVSPWMVGRFADTASARAFYESTAVPDAAQVGARGGRYMPVLFPGFSWHNLMATNHDGRPAPVDQIPRRCGRFLWQQAYLARSNGMNMAYGAMWDELAEGTAMMPSVAIASDFPAGFDGVALDRDACPAGSGYYAELAGDIAGQFSLGNIPSPTPPPAR